MFESTGHSVGADLARTKGVLELIRVTRSGREFTDDLFQGLMHLLAILNRHDDLLTKRGRATIPEELALPREIEERHRVACALLFIHADADAARTVAECLRLIVT